MIRADRDTGMRPFLLVAAAGTTDTGTVDLLLQLARREDVWFHIDAVYGGFFRLTVGGQERLAGIEQADSITSIRTRTLFMPFGTGCLIVRDIAALHAAHDGTGSYLQDMQAAGGVPDSGHLGPELTLEIRGLRAWLPLHLHGVDAFREALDEKLDLAEHVHDMLSGVAEPEVPHRPDRPPRSSASAPLTAAGPPASRPMRRVAVCWSGSTVTGASCSPARWSTAAMPCAFA
ncbi:pyridoxal-dependent decarboxylase [Streptomyces sp. NPDC001307]|uniref:pyridoxal-dependent decarboxylase n=1 Tax=Streptomyces sp. NPDC001307 TaxID=3364560 RepID=UPI003680E739